MSELTFKDGNHLSHAYIVSASSEETRNALADRLAQALVCSGGGSVPCGVCRDCRKAQEGIHPDIITVERQTDDKGGRRREIYVDQVRYMVSDAYVLPNEAARKVYIVRDADTMLDPKAVEKAAVSGDADALRGILSQVLGTDEGKRLAEKLKKAMEELRRRL